MALLLVVGFLAGMIVSISPCVLPVLPIILAGGATGGRRRPYAIIAGLVVSFTAFTLFAGVLLDALGLPDDFLRNLAIALLFVVAATLAFPGFAHLIERPFYFLTRRHAGPEAGGFVLGVSLGLVFVPCAGPVLAAVSVLAAREDFGLESILFTFAYALGAAVPLLAIALGGRRVSTALRARITILRPVLGGVVALTALAIALGVDRPFQTAIPGYVEALQDRVESSAAARRELARITSSRPNGVGNVEEGVLADFGPAPEVKGLSDWLNTPEGRALSLSGLEGRVVLVDFWTYSCINCLRTLPYLKAWDEAYRADGLTILGVHSPEFAFERVPDNVREAVRDLGVRYPVALDNDFETWDAFANRYWPSKYLIDRGGRVRYVHYGEGAYDETERVIRTLLAERGATPGERVAVQGADEASPETATRESYLGYLRLDRYAGTPVVRDRPAEYRFPSQLPDDHLAYAGTWKVEDERIVAGLGARLRLAFRARDVHLVLGGKGPVEVFLDGRRRDTVAVDGDRLYTLLRLPESRRGLLELRFAPGVEAYAFTFG
jgi:cytochrome c biogenesis protein CcdA/thiol-disulfide isomerase/thioredoxin